MKQTDDRNEIADASKPVTAEARLFHLRPRKPHPAKTTGAATAVAGPTHEDDDPGPAAA